MIEWPLNKFHSVVKTVKSEPAPNWKKIVATTACVFLMIIFSAYVHLEGKIEKINSAQIAKVNIESGAKSIPAELCNIKGNINAQGVKIYHMPGDFNYPQVAIDEVKGERWFCDEEHALSAGWERRALR